MKGEKILITALLIATVLCWGLTPIIEKIGLTKVSPIVGVTIRSITITVILVVVTILTGDIKDIINTDVKSISLFSLSGILAGLLGMWTYYQILKIGATSKIVPLAATYPLVTAMLSILILGEAVTLPRIIGTVLIVGGIYLVK
jgi:transporter family protein